jgi:hypothetical protein
MSTPTTFGEFVHMFGDILNVSIRLIIAGVFVFVIWKIIDAWIINAGDEKKREEGKQTALVSVLVMVLLAIVWGIVNLIRASIFG